MRPASMNAHPPGHPQTPPQLRVPLAQARGELLPLVFRGRELLEAFRDSAGPDLRSIASEEEDWHDSAYRWLKMRISDGPDHPAWYFSVKRVHTIKAALDRAGAEGPMWAEAALHMPNELASLEAQVKFLGSVLDQLELYEPMADSDAAGNERAGTSTAGPQINVYNPGQFNYQPQTVANINSSLTAIKNDGNADLAEALRSFAEAALNHPILDDGQREYVTHQVEELATEVAAPAGQRREWKIQACLGAIPPIIASATSLLQLWQQVEPIVYQLLPPQ